MTKRKIDDVELLLSKLDKKQLTDFIRKECANDSRFQDRFLTLGAGTLFKPNPTLMKCFDLLRMELTMMQNMRELSATGTNGNIKSIARLGI